MDCYLVVSFPKITTKGIIGYMGWWVNPYC